MLKVSIIVLFPTAESFGGLEYVEMCVDVRNSDLCFLLNGLVKGIYTIGIFVEVKKNEKFDQGRQAILFGSTGTLHY